MMSFRVNHTYLPDSKSWLHARLRPYSFIEKVFIVHWKSVIFFWKWNNQSVRNLILISASLSCCHIHFSIQFYPRMRISMPEICTPWFFLFFVVFFFLAITFCVCGKLTCLSENFFFISSFFFLFRFFLLLERVKVYLDFGRLPRLTAQLRRCYY